MSIEARNDYASWWLNKYLIGKIDILRWIIHIQILYKNIIYINTGRKFCFERTISKDNIKNTYEYWWKTPTKQQYYYD